MKKINKLQINSDRLMKNEELISLKGGTEDPPHGSYRCYRYGWMPGWCDEFITYINTASCGMALVICNEVYGGGCVEC